MEYEKWKEEINLYYATQYAKTKSWNEFYQRFYPEQKSKEDKPKTKTITKYSAKIILQKNKI